MRTLPRLDCGSTIPSSRILFHLHILPIAPVSHHLPYSFFLYCIMSYHRSVSSLPALPTLTMGSPSSPGLMSLMDLANFPPAHIDYRLGPQIISLFTHSYQPSYPTLRFSPCVRHSPLLSPFFPLSIFNGTVHRTVAGLSARP